MTEDFLAVVQAKRFLGREFLTWVVHRIETGDGRLAVGNTVVELQLGDRIVLAGESADKARLTVAGAGDMGAEMGAGLRRGKLVDRARLVLRRGERTTELTLDGGMLTFEGLACPKLGPRGRADKEDARAAFENDLFLRLADVEEAVATIDVLFAEFCRVRGSSTWKSRTLPVLRAWVEELQ